MSLFYVDKKLFIGSSPQRSTDLFSLAKKCKTPFYVYDLSGMEQEVARLKSALGPRGHIHFAVKANSNEKILTHFAKLGVGADVVSMGEAILARRCGFKPEKIIFSGVAKERDEIEYAITEGIKQINVESPGELRRVAEIGGKLGLHVPIAFRLNPNVNPQTHPYITTGFKENKFGMDESFLPELIAILKAEKKALDLQGVTLHIGSQLRNNAIFKEAIEKTIPVFRLLQEQGFTMKSFDVGGGIGIDYEQGVVDSAQVEDYGRMVQRLLGPLHIDILAEPGRVVSACHGVLVCEIQYIKKTPFKEFAIVNTGMHHLLRPSLYQAFHRILPLIDFDREMKEYDVVGPICESSDFLAKGRSLKELFADEFLAVAEAGAYGRSMASQYNAHSYPEELVFYQGELV